MRFLLAFAVVMSLAADNVSPLADQRVAREIYSQLISFPSGFSTGATTPAAEAMAARFRAAGFPAQDIHVFGAIPKKGNLVVRYRGTGDSKPLLLLAHLDVVEALRSDWSMDPFVLTEKEGYFYGRGTGDDKAHAALWVATLLRIKREGFRPKRDIILALTADEEGGGPYNGVEWLLKNHRDLIDAGLCLNEGGWGDSDHGKRVSNNVQVAEKYVLTFRFEAKNPGGHSSVPVKDNAIYHLAAALDRLAKFDFPIELNPITRTYFERVASTQSGRIASDLKATAGNDAAAMDRIAALSPAWNATLRTTCVATMLDGGHALNALPQTAGATVNCRVMSEDDPDQIRKTLERVVADPVVTVAPLGEQFGRSEPSPLSPELMGAVEKVTDSMWPSVPVIPTMVMGATDGRSLRMAGIPTYGIMGLFMDRDDIRMHGRDERVRVQSFYEAQEFLYRLVKALS